MNYTEVVVAVITTVPATVAAFVAAWVAVQNRNSLKTPSGDPIGQVVERGHDLSAADLAVSTKIMQALQEEKRALDKRQKKKKSGG